MPAGPGAVDFKIERVGEKGERVPEVRGRGGESKSYCLHRETTLQGRVEDCDGIVVIDETESRGGAETNGDRGEQQNQGQRQTGRPGLREAIG